MTLKPLLKIFTLIFATCLSCISYADTLKPFTSDGCSAFPDGTSSENTLWLSCCRKHDFDYWKGGTFEERVTSDIKLKQCVSEVGEPQVALLMLAGVRIGGTPYLPTSFRWGYGWPYPKGYGKLTIKELAQVQKLSESLHLSLLD